METKTLIELIDYLCRPGQRTRNGIWLVPDEAIGREENIIHSMRRACDAVDMQAAILKRRPGSSTRAGIRVDRLQEWIDDILENNVMTDSVVLYNFDLPLAYLSATDRDRVWDILRTVLVRRSKALIVALPSSAVGILIREDCVEEWRSENRVCW